MQASIIYDPLVTWWFLGALAFAMAAVLGIALWRRLAGWWLRAGAALVVLIALANPSYQIEQRDPLADIVFVVVDQSASQEIAGRPEQTARAVNAITARLESLANTEIRIVEVGDAAKDAGTLMMAELAQAMADVPKNQIAGTIIISDGQTHDEDQAPDNAAPLHLLLTGRANEWDRRLIVTNSPGFGILGEPLELTLRIEDQGQVPAGMSPFADLAITVDGGVPFRTQVPIGQDLTLPLTLQHGGMNVVQLQIEKQNSELTDRNNSAVVQINSVRDRLSVLLVSGEPYPGERTWRNLLKSDSSVDLVHFTILRPPQKQDSAPVSELALIAFPTRELFLDKIEDFDLIIFDRYRRRGILPTAYLENVRNYVENGGAVLIAAGPGFASAESLFRSPLGNIIPAIPTSRVLEAGFKPEVSEIGERHPVSAGLDGAKTDQSDEPEWGRWFRLIELQEDSGDTILSGPEGRPLLVLDRVGQGRVALLASDQAWLWGRGFEGGGPQQELLRRLAHWMMKEPELEEESLTASAQGQQMEIVRRTLGQDARSVELTSPDGSVVVLDMENTAPGQFVAQYDAPDMGLYRLKQGDLTTVVALGSSAPQEFVETIATGEKLQATVDETRGGIVLIEQGLPDLRLVQSGRNAAGRGWIGITPRNAYLTTDVRLVTLLPAWAALLLMAALSVSAWLWEGRR